MNVKLQISLLTTAEVGKGPERNYFEFRNVCKAFGDLVVLQSASFQVKRGETRMITIPAKWKCGLPRDRSGQGYFLRTETTEAA